MEIIHLRYDALSNVQEDQVMAIGFFDGVHVGHQRLLEEVLKVARRDHLKPSVMTFNVHPLDVLNDQKRTYLTTLEDRIAIFEKMGMDYVFVIDFDRRVAALTPDTFIEHYLIRQHVVHLICGFDFRFGVRNSGGIDQLSHQPFALTVIPPVKDQKSRKVSSSLIKELLSEGHVEEAEKLLGCPYRIKGTVIHGKHRGQALGFPTANIEMGTYAPLKRGVYGVSFILAGRTYQGMANIGMNPTFHDLTQLSLEVHIFDFDQEIYGQEAVVSFHFFHRDEQLFTSTDALIGQLYQDEKEIKALMKKA
ncbi:MAG: riboflavin biosynthesis protein RibF [bacterium]